MSSLDVSPSSMQSCMKEIRFEKGLPGFPHLYAFLLEQTDPELPLATLQSLDDENVSFLIGDPFVFFADYEFDLSPDVEMELEVKEASELTIWAIITFKGSLIESTMNLRAPLVINNVRLFGKQVILNDSRYTLRQPLMAKSDNGGIKDAGIKP